VPFPMIAVFFAAGRLVRWGEDLFDRAALTLP
jgi:hypothetical protein